MHGKLIRALLSAMLVGSSGFLIGLMYTMEQQRAVTPDPFKIMTTASVSRHMSNMTSNSSSYSESSVNSSLPTPNTTVEAYETFLKYDPKNFSYPADFNLKQAVHDLIDKNNSIPEVHKRIHLHNFEYLHSPEPCTFPRDEKRNRNMLILVKSFAGNFNLRKTQRALLKKTKLLGRTKQVFILGYNATYQDFVDTESRKFKDIIQEDFVDTYLNNTLKTVMAYNWVDTFCRDASILFFVDDDYYVHYDKIFKHIRAVFQQKSTGIFAGTLASRAVPYRRHETVWSLTFDQYPYDYFPPYIGGGAYIVSHDVAHKFAVSFPYVQFLGIDDAYLGIVAKKLDIPPSYNPNFDTAKRTALARECSHSAQELANHQCPIAKRKSEFIHYRRPRKPVSWLDILPVVIFLNLLFMIGVWCSN
ncbi:beta-1,3-galactosyltransferase brn-like [Mizuhopecten yessoensis]|uniref:Hexosyltransferase n=1 Tax=Mizuhopecten yessoensis TaxID=6573 RepID=A0A210QK05_MIZYE|nr:beta-1,3-galactosyltransferase brn-like [Mizuhopecten yessoensis]OWF49087.1 Beta-1,3-galactosyltransferase 1 [Mizuhopecten yessoensis]